jgi:hypothetical protein
MSRITLLLTILLTCQFSIAEEVNVKKLNKIQWLSVTSDNFKLTTDADKKLAISMIEELERFRYFMTFSLGFEQQPLDEKIPFVLAKRASTYKAMGITKNYIGLFVNKDDERALFAYAKGFRESTKGQTNSARQTVFHELVHLFMNNASFKLATPPWFSEGVAEYLGTYVEKKGNIILGDLSSNQGRFYALIKPAGGFYNIDTESLFKTQRLNIKENENRTRSKYISKFYARALAVVHYMSADKDRRQQMYRYLYLLKKGFSEDDTFKHIFNKTYAELDDEVNSYIKGRFVVAREINIKNSGINFPKVDYIVSKIEQRAAVKSIVSKISLLSERFISFEHRKAMFEDVEAIYPGIFKPIVIEDES